MKVFIFFLITIAIAAIGANLYQWGVFFLFGTLAGVLMIVLFFKILGGIIDIIMPRRKNEEKEGKISRVHTSGSAKSVIIENEEYVGVLTRITKKKPAPNSIWDGNFDDEERKTYSAAEMWQDYADQQTEEELRDWKR